MHGRAVRPALIGSMINKASLLEGACSLFAAIIAPSTNAHIADELLHFVVQDDGFKTLIEAGEKTGGALASHDSLTQLSERIVEHTGVAASATRKLSGVIGATVLGVLKRYFTQHNGNVGQLPTRLGHQLPIVRANMTDAFAHALGLGSVGAFLAGVVSRLKAVLSHLDHPVAQQAAAFPIQTGHGNGCRGRRNKGKEQQEGVNVGCERGRSRAVCGAGGARRLA